MKQARTHSRRSLGGYGLTVRFSREAVAIPEVVCARETVMAPVPWVLPSLPSLKSPLSLPSLPSLSL